MTARQQQRPSLAFCVSCNARERAIVAGRCIVCGEDPKPKPLSEQYPGQVCPTCQYAYGNDDQECGNPVCLANPTLSDDFRAELVRRAEQYRAEEAARAERQRLYSLSFKGAAR